MFSRTTSPCTSLDILVCLNLFTKDLYNPPYAMYVPFSNSWLCHRHSVHVTGGILSRCRCSSFASGVFPVIQHPRFTSDVFFCAQLFYAPASALPAPDNHATRLFADPRQPRTRCPVSQLWMSVFSQPCGTLAIACDVMFPATHATSHAPESDLSFNASSFCASHLRLSKHSTLCSFRFCLLASVRSYPPLFAITRNRLRHATIRSSSAPNVAKWVSTCISLGNEPFPF